MSKVEIILLILLVVVTVLSLGTLLFLIQQNKKNKQALNNSEGINEQEIKATINDLQTKIAQDIQLSFAKANGENDRKTDTLVHHINLSLERNNSSNIEKDNIRTNQLKEEIDNKLKALNEQVNAVLKESNEVNKTTYSELGATLNKLVAANAEVVKVGEEVKDLNKTIKGDNQKRGRFGEFILETIITNVFGDTKGQLYDFQYNLGGDSRPDAVVFLPKNSNNILAIDSKFPYSNYKIMFDEQTGEINPAQQKIFESDVTKRIREVASKYIIADKTTNYALCFLPSDEIYNFININLEKVVELSRKSNVILVSPATLQPVLYTLKSLAIEYKRSIMLEEINKQLLSLGTEFERLVKRWDGHSKLIDSLYRSGNEIDTTISKLNKRFEKISSAADDNGDNDNLKVDEDNNK